MRIAYLALSTVLVLTVACPPAAPPALSDADKAAIDSLDREFARLANAADFASLVKMYYATDAVMLPPNAPAVQGQGNIEAFLRTFPPISNMQLHTDEVDGVGDLAYVRGRYTMTLTPPGGAAMADSGKYLEVFRRQSDKSWKAVRDMFSSDLPLPAPAPPKKS